MKIKKIIIEDNDGNELEFDINDGCGIFITSNNNNIILPSNNANIKLELIKQILK